jgi:NADH:ubiquinone oxidoreductase subunit
MKDSAQELPDSENLVMYLNFMKEMSQIPMSQMDWMGTQMDLRPQGSQIILADQKPHIINILAFCTLGKLL